MKTRLNCKKLSFCLLLGIAISVGSYAQNKKISFQGFLKDNQGKAVSNGNYSMVFSLYDVNTNGTALWTETIPTVSVVDGIYAVQLGATTSLTTLLWDKPYFMGININGNGELVPRTELTYSPYAFSVERALTVACSGDIGDIKYSILNPTQFKAQNGDCWVPMDGGSMASSKLAVIIGGTTLPNGGGMFLRGQDFTNTDNDPERTSTSPIATLQGDKFQEHEHYASSSNAGDHTHTVSLNTRTQDNGGYVAPGMSFVSVQGTDRPTNIQASPNITTAGAHNHTITVWGAKTGNMSPNETRPKNLNFWVYIRIN